MMWQSWISWGFPVFIAFQGYILHLFNCSTKMSNCMFRRIFSSFIGQSLKKYVLSVEFWNWLIWCPCSSLCPIYYPLRPFLCMPGWFLCMHVFWHDNKGYTGFTLLVFFSQNSKIDQVLIYHFTICNLFFRTLLTPSSCWWSNFVDFSLWYIWSNSSSFF